MLPTFCVTMLANVNQLIIAYGQCAYAVVAYPVVDYANPVSSAISYNSFSVVILHLFSYAPTVFSRSPLYLPETRHLYPLCPIMRITTDDLLREYHRISFRCTFIIHLFSGFVKIFLQEDSIRANNDTFSLTNSERRIN